MFEYKDASFYTSFFKNHPDFNVLEEFKESEDKEEKNIFVGFVEVLNTVHPLQLRVEIPKVFPHQKLTFRTKSLSGYPHLIHSWDNKNGDWFCLNTPFAETAEEQLNQEVFRLKQWLDKCQHIMKECPAIIEDLDVINALRRANVYEWENLDEVNEFRENAVLTFVGDFSNDISCFKEKVGFLHCIETPDKRYYAFREKHFTNFEMPYILVDEFPKDKETYKDFIALRNQYGWDKSVCDHLFPGFELSSTWVKHYTQHHSLKRITLDESLEIIKKIKNEIAKDEAYLDAWIKGEFGDQSSSRIKLLPQQKVLISEEIDSLEKKVIQDNGYDNTGILSMTLEEMADQPDPEWEMERYLYEFHHFALGVIQNNTINWFVVSTNHQAREAMVYAFDLDFYSFQLDKILSHHIVVQLPQIVEKNLFYGRGMFSSHFQKSRIALVGLGAIGSMLAESLARSGVTVLGLWDNDTIEPGNICRSTYMLSDLGENKAIALKKRIQLINPFLKPKEIVSKGNWLYRNANDCTYIGGSFYNNINYDDQEKSLKSIENYDMIIDCTGSNEMLHFLSYAAPDKTIISLCITNRSNDLLCVTNKNGNPFELRKTYLSRIEQDTKNFYMEGSGCYSPTFLATNSDIASLVNLVLREMNLAMEQNKIMGSMVLSHGHRGILIDRLENYRLDGFDIRMVLPRETHFDAEEMDDVLEGPIGYFLGNYSRDGQLIMVTHVVEAIRAKDVLTEAYNTSKGIIDYIGDLVYSDEQPNTCSKGVADVIAAKAQDETINTNNPLLAIRNPDRTISYFLYINNELVPFIKEE